MPARLRPMHQEVVRTKIQTSQLINRLQDHALGKITLEPSQIKAIEVLIRKTLPDLSQVTATLTPAADMDRSAAVAEAREIFGPPRLVASNG